jgi:hypothetical protein
MPLNTTDVNKTICMEMRMAKAMNILNLCHGGTKSSGFETPPSDNIGPNKFTFPSIDAATIRTIPTPNSRNAPALSSKHSCSATAVTSNTTSNNSTSHYNNNNNNNNHNYNYNYNHKDNYCNNSNFNVHNSTNADLASVDSSDTFMSCQTHPFLSQGDLTTTAIDDDVNLCDYDMIDAEHMYMNAMGGGKQESRGVLMRGTSLHSGPVNIIVDSSYSATAGQVKKSTSGDTALRSLAASPIDEQYSSRVSLNETPVPKHRKTRFQQQQQQQVNSSNRQKTRFDDGKESDEIGSGAEASAASNSANSSSSSNNNKKNRRASFMPSKIITTATKQLINQHLFGLQSLGSKGTCVCVCVCVRVCVRLCAHI